MLWKPTKKEPVFRNKLVSWKHAFVFVWNILFCFVLFFYFFVFLFFCFYVFFLLLFLFEPSSWSWGTFFNFIMIFEGTLIDFLGEKVRVIALVSRKIFVYFC